MNRREKVIPNAVSTGETASDGVVRFRLVVRGQVQGVGFRPYVYRLARQMTLAGHVSNNAAGAMIEVQGTADQVERFCEELVRQLPPLAEIAEVRRESLAPVEEEGFTIHGSDSRGTAEAHVTMDACVCGDCLREMMDPADRRYRYPFINCTNCGPRYTIVKHIPYDRPNTTMAVFPMCDACRKEYEDPGDRRFHAQPVACPVCGPKVWLAGDDGEAITCRDAIAEAAHLLKQGRIVAIKGLGGFHLACLAGSEEAVLRLRRRKNRDQKPFGMMAGDMATIEGVAEVSAEARRLLESPARPIVLLPRKGQTFISELVAPGTNTYGIMLPYTPLHHLLFAEGLDLLVMTSGNLSDEPICKDNPEAVTRLRGIADAFLLHDRDIERRVDDSVAQARGDGLSLLRRARGYVPRPVLMTQSACREILAVGPELKNTVCLLRGNQAVLSEHIGDLTNPAAYRHFLGAIEHLKGLLEARPEVVAHDLHPMYMSTQYARQLRGVRLIGVQHHFAHVLSGMAEHQLYEPVIGIAADGTGYGDDGAIWGCEIMRVERGGYSRLGHLRYFPLPGGDAAAREMCRPGLSLLRETFGTKAYGLEMVRRIDEPLRSALYQMLENRAATVSTSSLGRLFDAAAWMVGVGDENEFEGQGPMALEAIIEPDEDYYPHAVVHHGRRFELDYRPMVSAMLADVESRVSVGRMAARFHNTLAELLKVAAVVARDLTDLTKVVLSGGCFANQYLTTRLEERLRDVGFQVYSQHAVPCNDGGVALGQAIHAAAVIENVRKG